MKTGLPLTKTVLMPLTKTILIPLGSTATTLATDSAIQQKKKKKILGLGTTLIISNKEKDGIIKIVKSFE